MDLLRSLNRQEDLEKDASALSKCLSESGSSNLKPLYCKERQLPPKESVEMTVIQWPGPNEKQVIDEMLENRDSAHWEKCSELMKCLIMQQAKKLTVFLSSDVIDDILQNTMMSVIINLSLFRFESKLTTWLTTIAYTRTIDALRLRNRNIQINAPLVNPLEGEESEVVTYELEVSGTLEEICTTNEKLREVLAEISAYIRSHASSERNRKIAEMVLLAGRTLEEAAREVGVSAAVASYFIRTLRRHLEEKFGPSSPSE